MNDQDELQLTSESVNSISNEVLADYFSRLYQYLQVSGGTTLLRRALKAALPSACSQQAPLSCMCMVDCHLSAMQVVENRLFSEGLHVLGQPPSQQHMAQYLQAYFDKGLSHDAVSAVVEQRGEGLEAVRYDCIACCSSHLLESIKHGIFGSLLRGSPLMLCLTLLLTCSAMLEQAASGGPCGSVT